MAKYLLRQKWYIAIILMLIIIEPSLNSMLNFWLQRLFNSAEPGVDKLVILRLLTYGFLLWMIKRLVVFAAGVLRTRFICNAKQDVKQDMFRSLLGLRTANLSTVASSGEYISLFTNDITILETRFYNQIVSLVSGVVSIIILGSAFYILNAKLAAAIMAFGVVTMFVPVAFSNFMNQRNLGYSNAISGFTQRIKEYVVAYPTIKNYSIEQAIGDKFNEANEGTEEAKFEADYALTLANNVGQLLSWFMQFISVGFGLMLVRNGEITIGTVVAARSFASDLAAPLQNTVININSIRSVKDIIRKLETMSHLNRPQSKMSLDSSEPLAPAPNVEASNQGCRMEFVNVSLTVGETKIVEEFTFTFEPGKKYLIVGLNGAGKSSIFRIMKQWYDDCGGQILIDGVDVNQISSEQLSRTVSYLNESVSLFSGSVRDNVVLFQDQDPQAVAAAISSAQLRLDLDRQIQDEGRNVSSGEQRRIEIARSLIGSVKGLIFDEVVSTLDIETAYEIEKLALSFGNKTVVFISHNFSGKLIREYDEILVIDRGRLLAQGNYSDLIQSNDYFRNICEIKFGNIQLTA